MKWSAPREDEAVKRLKTLHPDMVIHEDEDAGYYIREKPDGFVAARNIYDIYDIRSKYKGYVYNDRTRPLLYKKGDIYYIIVTDMNIIDMSNMIDRQLIFV